MQMSENKNKFPFKVGQRVVLVHFEQNLPAKALKARVYAWGRRVRIVSGWESCKDYIQNTTRSPTTWWAPCKEDECPTNGFRFTVGHWRKERKCLGKRRKLATDNTDKWMLVKDWEALDKMQREEYAKKQTV
jgi:hypothetical protein